MKKRKTTLLAFSLLSMLAVGTTGCSCAPQTENQTVSSVIVQDVKNGAVGDKIQLRAIVIGSDNQEVTWSSNNEAVASVDASGLVTLKSAGSVEIMATSVANSEVSSSPAHITVYEAGSKTLEVASLPTKVKYKVGEKVSYEGISIMAYSFVDGVKDSASGEVFTTSDVSFSIPEGTELKEEGAQVVTITKEGYASTSFTLQVGQVVTEKKLYISRFPNTTTYTLKAPEKNPEGEKTAIFDDSGLKVEELTYVNGNLDSRETLSDSDFTLSLPSGSILKTEGTQEITITSKVEGVEGTSFNIMVYTEDKSAYDIIKQLSDTKNVHNYTAEVFNDVGTTNDTTGFHYLRHYTEDYYWEIDYQNVKNGTEIEFDTTNPKSRSGYTAYKDGDEEGIMELNFESGDVLPGRVVSTGYDSWWGKASSLARLFTLFDLNDVPTETLNGRYLSTIIVPIEGDNDMGEKTCDKYPFVASFLDYCGWSSSLITIMNRLTITFDEDNNLNITADFGSYGSTKLVVKDIGTTRVNEVENYLTSTPIDARKPNRTVEPGLATIANEGFKSHNYTQVEYGDNGVERNSPQSYYNPNYFYSVAGEKGYAKVTVDGVEKLQEFTGKDNKFVAAAEPKDIPDGKTFQSYVNELVITDPDINKTGTPGYAAEGMQDVFGVNAEDDGLLYTFSINDAMTVDTMVTYQSFDDSAMASLKSFIGLNDPTEYSLWIMANYNSYTDPTSYTDLSNIASVEMWVIDPITLRGFVMAFVDMGSTSIDWIEEGIATCQSTLNAETAALN